MPRVRVGSLSHTCIECLLDARYCSGVGVTKIGRAWAQPLHSEKPEWSGGHVSNSKNRTSAFRDVGH